MPESESRQATCAQCQKSFTYRTRPAYGNWAPTLCLKCKGVSAQPLMPHSKATRSGPPRPDPTGGCPSSGIFTDGGCSPNPGPGGWAFVVVHNDRVVAERFGGDPYTTNNRMELTAILEALRYVLDPSHARLLSGVAPMLYADSNLCVQTYNDWIDGWAKRGWSRKTGPIENLDLVQQLFELKQQDPPLQLNWIKAHSGLRWNEYADQLVQKGRQQRCR